MRIIYFFGIGALILSLSASAVARPDVNAFLNRKVSDTSGLVAQIKDDPEVADRYERHFSMSKGEVVDYMVGLHRSTLDRDGMYTVYSVPNGGRLKMHVEKLKKGEPVFVDATGRPALIVKCGNPVTRGPRKGNRGNPVVLVPTDESSTRTLVPDVPDALALDAPGQLVALAPPVPDIPPPAPIVEIPPVEPLPPTVPVTAIGGGRFPWFAGLPILFPLVGSGSRNGGGESVPEPASMVVLGVGLVAVARRRRKA